MSCFFLGLADFFDSFSLASLLESCLGFYRFLGRVLSFGEPFEKFLLVVSGEFVAALELDQSASFLQFLQSHNESLVVGLRILGVDAFPQSLA